MFEYVGLLMQIVGFGGAAIFALLFVGALVRH